MGRVKWYINGVEFASYGVYVSKSDGIIGLPARKSSYSQDWNNYHGSIPYAEKVYYKERTITLDCFIVGTSDSDLADKAQTFLRAFSRNRASWESRTDRLLLDITPGTSEPQKCVIPYEVSLESATDIRKEWRGGNNVGTFTLRLIEHEPCKRVLCHIVTSASNDTASITVSSGKLLNIYWGDGRVEFDVSGTSVNKTHTYTAAGTYYIVICGCIDEISAFTIDSSATSLKWTRLP